MAKPVILDVRTDNVYQSIKALAEIYRTGARDGATIAAPSREPGYCTWAISASMRSRAFFGIFVVLAASRFAGASPTWIRATMPIA